MTTRVERAQAIAFRVARHDLARRRPPGDVEGAVAGGLQDTPLGAVRVSLHARVEGFDAGVLERALHDKRVVELWAMRGAPHVVPARDVALFTAGIDARDDDSLRAKLASFAGHLERAGIAPGDAIARVAAEVDDVLGDATMTKPELSTAVSRRLPPELVPWCDACKVHHVSESALRTAAHRGSVLVAPWAGRHVALVRTATWLGSPRAVDTDEARRALLVRYLERFAPSTPGDFAEWCNVGPADARRTWELVAGDLARVELDGRAVFARAADVAELESPPQPRGVRLLPAHDSYLSARDRVTIVPDDALRKQVWRTIGNPGAVLVDGEVAGTWRGRKKGASLEVSVRVAAHTTRAARAGIEDETAALAPLRGCSRVRLSFDG
ncbi:MAG TPA: winged helix DNA-binding domain-containing protein [Actinomycetota bacterium]|nr:winged helix DNA-binding domain-containing protein [Actinomycetota bacterium]